MRLESSVISEIKNSVDIVEVISSYLPLTAKGKNYFGVCPFHDDHSPSMSVSKDKQIFTCFSCGATGNVFQFLQDFENISFIESVSKCAEMAGIPLNLSNQYERKPNKYQELYDIYEVSQKFYQNNMNSSQAKEAKEYLYKRELNDEVIREFEIGLSLNDSNMLAKLLKKKNYSDRALLESGLIGEEQNKVDLYDLYRNRIMFPLHDSSGKLVAYNGRAYHGENTNKYVNTKETSIFKKREILYNYHRAKDAARIKKQVIIMEGPMDVIRAYTIGVTNAVASLGTAFGSEQAMLIRKLSSDVVLCFDGDAAGLKATKSALEEFSKIGIQPKIVRLEEDMDPDEYIKKYGKKVFLEKIENAMNPVEFKEFLLKADLDMNNSVDMANYANSMLEEIKKMNDEVLREISITKLSEETHLSLDFLRSKITTVEARVEKNEVDNTRKKRLTKCEKSERNLLFYMLRYTNAIKMYDKKITHMPTDKYRHLAFQVSTFLKQYGYIDIADLLTELREDEEAIQTIGELSALALREEMDVDEIEDYLKNIKEYNERLQMDKYRRELSNSDNYSRKLELAQKLVEYKMRSEEENARD